MIPLSDYSIFKSHICELKETSLDDRGGASGTVAYMTTNKAKVVNFDSVKEEYVKNLHLSQVPKSNDAFWATVDGFVFVEFKNGYIDKAKEYEIRKKIYDSMLIFTDITSSEISNTRSCVDYVLVYSQVANSRQDSDGGKKLNNTVSQSPSINKIGKVFSELGKTNYVQYGVDIFRGYCFRNVYTFTENEFELYLRDNPPIPFDAWPALY